MITTEDIAWCAGVIDSLGLVRIRELENGTDLPEVFVSTAKEPIAAKLSELTGTKVVTIKRDYNRLGCGDHCTEPHLHVLSTTARWSLVGARATVFLSACLPYLRVQEVKEVVNAGLQAPMKPATPQKMYQLGWPVLVTQKESKDEQSC